jgi:hypothetical protein
LYQAGIWDPIKEIAGLNKGTDALMKQYGVKEIVADPQLVEKLPGNILESVKRLRLGDAARETKDLVQQIMAHAAGVHGGVTYTPIRHIYRGPAGGLMADSPGTEAILRRHEMDEARLSLQDIARGQQRKGGWTIPTTRGGQLERVLSLTGKTPRGVIEEMLPEGSLREIGGRIADKILAQPIRQSTGHISPAVLARESENLSMMPTAVQRQYKELRSLGPEMSAIEGAGGQYGKRLSPDVTAKLDTDQSMERVPRVAKWLATLTGK